MRAMRGTAMPDGHAVCQGMINWLEHRACSVLKTWSVASRIGEMFSIRQCDLEMFFMFAFQRSMPRMFRPALSGNQYLCEQQGGDIEKTARALFDMATDEGVLNRNLAMMVLAKSVDVYRVNPWEYPSLEPRMETLEKTGEARI